MTTDSEIADRAIVGILADADREDGWPDGAKPNRADAPNDASNWRDRIRLTPASKFKIKPVRWVWEGRIPLGELSLIPGREGVGKSTFLAWLTSAITNGNLPGRFLGQPRAVLYAATEDSWDYTIAPRMIAAGANLDMVFRIDVIDEAAGSSGLILPRDCHYLPDIAQETNAAVLMCDPIMSMVDEKLSTFKAQELRKALEPLKRYAEKAGIAVPALVHFNKGSSPDVGTLIAGARAWAEVARAVIGIARDQEADEYTCVVSQVKNNLGRTDLPNLKYTIDGVTLETDEGEPAHVGRLRWTGESERSVEDILAAGMSGEDRRQGDASKKVVSFVAEEALARGCALSTAEIVAAFDGELKPENVRKILSRAVTAKLLESPTRGVYLGRGVTNSDHEAVILSQTGTQSARSSSVPLIPPVTTSQVSQQQVRGGIDGVTTMVGSCHKCHKPTETSKPIGAVVTCDSCDRGERAGARASNSSIPNPQDPHGTCSRCGFGLNAVGHFVNCEQL